MNSILATQIAKGILSRIPGLFKTLTKGRGLQTLSARYCYSVWLRILRAAHEQGGMDIPRMVVELGPGSSLGIGLAGLLSGVERYYAFDVGEYAQVESNLKVFEQLLDLFKKQAPIPNDEEFPEVIPKFGLYDFPKDLLTDEYLAGVLTASRIESIRLSIKNMRLGGSTISYVTDAADPTKLKDEIREPVDFVFSVAVMEHVDDILSTYNVLDSIIKPGGYVAHAIDYRSHGCAKQWNGHWTYSDFTWNLVKGKRPLINRTYHSQHVKAIETRNEILWIQKQGQGSRISVEQLAPPFKSVTQEDLGTYAAFVLAKRRMYSETK